MSFSPLYLTSVSNILVLFTFPILCSVVIVNIPDKLLTYLTSWKASIKYEKANKLLHQKILLGQTILNYIKLIQKYEAKENLVNLIFQLYTLIYTSNKFNSNFHILNIISFNIKSRNCYHLKT